MKHLNI